MNTVGVLADITPRTLKLAGIVEIYIGRGGNAFQGVMISDTGDVYRITLQQRLEILRRTDRFEVGAPVLPAETTYPLHKWGEGFLRVKILKGEKP